MALWFHVNPYSTPKMLTNNHKACCNPCQIHPKSLSIVLWISWLSGAADVLVNHVSTAMPQFLGHCDPGLLVSGVGAMR